MPDLLTIQTVDRCLLISIQQSRPLAVVQELEWVAIELTLPDPQDFSMSILKDRQPEGYVLKGPSLYRCTWTVFLRSGYEEYYFLLQCKREEPCLLPMEMPDDLGITTRFPLVLTGQPRSRRNFETRIANSYLEGEKK